MKDKTDDTGSAHSALSLPITNDTAFIKRKKPHVLPPLDKFRNLEGRGSPIPQVRRSSSIEEQLLLEEGSVAPAEGRPVIRLTRCEELSAPNPLVVPTRLPPPKRGSLSPPADAYRPFLSINNVSGPGPGDHSPHLTTMGSKYVPLQPIRRGSDNSPEENGNTIK